MDAKSNYIVVMEDSLKKKEEARNIWNLMPLMTNPFMLSRKVIPIRMAKSRRYHSCVLTRD